jgi:NAD(P)-dependent dehydrogenase (short-subunit alcohol dehydrogenase family)
MRLRGASQVPFTSSAWPKASSPKQKPTVRGPLAPFSLGVFQRNRPALLKNVIGLPYFAEPEEVAYLVAYVASPLARTTTGAALRQMEA